MNSSFLALRAVVSTRLNHAVLNERDKGDVQTFQPTADVFKGRSVRNIVQEQCGICAAVIHGCLFVTHQSWMERQIERTRKDKVSRVPRRRCELHQPCFETVLGR